MTANCACAAGRLAMSNANPSHVPMRGVLIGMLLV